MSEEEIIANIAKAIMSQIPANDVQSGDCYDAAIDSYSVVRDTIEAIDNHHKRRIAVLEAELFTLKFVRSEMTNGLLAKTMWDAYCVQGGGKTFDGKPLPTWDDLGEERQACWIAAAEAARAALGEKND